MTSLLVEVIKTHPDAILPEYKTDGASGMDLVALEEVKLQPARIGGRLVAGAFFEGDYRSPKSALINTGIALSIPLGWEAQIRPRSSFSAAGILCPIGTIDSDYRGEIKVCLINTNGEPFLISPGDRIAQIVFAPVGRAALKLVDQFTVQTARGAGGWGSTGRRD